MDCVKLSEFIKCLENIYTENEDLDLYSWNGKVVDLDSFVQLNEQLIIIDQQYMENTEVSPFNMACIKLSGFIKYLENIYTEHGDLDLHSCHGKVVDLDSFIETDEQLILIDQKGIDTED